MSATVPRRILWVPSWYPTPEAPLNGSFFAEQVEHLRRAGHRVAVAATSPLSAATLRRQGPRHALTMHQDRDDPRIVRLGVPIPPPRAQMGDSAVAKERAQAIIRRWRGHRPPEVIHAHSALPGLLVARELAHAWGVPYGFTEHRPSSLELPPNHPRTCRLRDYVGEAAFRIGVASEFSAALATYYDAPFTTVPLPVAEYFFDTALRKPGETFTFLHVSLVDDNKRADTVVKACAALAETHADIRCRIIGASGEVARLLTELAQRLGISERVSIEPPADRAAIAEAMSHADCFVLYSRVEAGGTVLGEALASGTPIVASATTAGRSYASRATGGLVPVDDHAALVTTMEDVYRRRRSGDLAPAALREYARTRFSPAAFAERQGCMYEQAIVAHSPSR
ncbi:glycosyltransferase [Nanchangia anserum]|uniref:Glycosyltransferase n=1 Tax=Nanchangia anserum TaxID=2692125 RepID=A0A8I0GFY8_9ACTO|nr:glycosyltransferase [Nanchangia anserum]MBD3690117.1 glycosyltransferase [Nanchangia anserum]QOX82098.1 glycosyltransferase [Nanchangia anserum]